MSEVMLIEFGAEGVPVHAGLISEEIGWVRSVPLDDLRAEAGHEAVLVLDGRQIASHRVQVPDFPDFRLRQVLSGLMDECIGRAGQDVHFALFGGRDAGNGQRTVAVVETGVLKQAMSYAADLGFRVFSVIPDYCLLADGAAGRMEDGRVLARFSGGTGFSADGDAAELMTTDDLTIRALDAQEWQGLLAGAANKLENLLQGGFGLQPGVGAVFLWFRRAVVLAVVLLVVWGGVAFYEASRNFSATESLQADTETLFREALPNVKRVVNMDVQMRRAIRAMREKGGNEFLVLSTLTVEAVAGQETTTIESMRFDAGDGTLVFSVSFDSFSSGEQFKKKLQASGLMVTEGNSRAERGRVLSDLTVRRRV